MPSQPRVNPRLAFVVRLFILLAFAAGSVFAAVNGAPVVAALAGVVVLIQAAYLVWIYGYLRAHR